MNVLMAKGRRKVMLALALMWITPLPLLYWQRSPIGWGSVLVTAVLSFLLLRGANWARLLLGLLTGLGGVAVLLAPISSLSVGFKEVLLLGMGIASLVSSLLFISTDVRAYTIGVRRGA